MTLEMMRETDRLGRLIGYLEADPDNAALLTDAASAAVEAQKPERALALIERLEAIAPLHPTMINLRGVAALQAGRYREAVEAFEAVRASEDNPTLSFNLAWALAMAQEHEAALALLDDEVVAAGPRAAALKVGLLHQLERVDEALAYGETAAARYPDDAHLMGALASVALDAEQVELAKAYAARSGTSHDGLTTLGMLLLDEERTADSAALFERVLAADGTNARALLGRGLAMLNEGRLDAAITSIDAAAERFGDHLGSWVAAGWAHYLRGDLAASRARFETALEIDDSFAEIQGGLAVIDIAEGEIERARHRTEVALRLDKTCFAAALARSMLLEREGNSSAAERIRQAALDHPIGPGGRTIARSLAAQSGSR